MQLIHFIIVFFQNDEHYLHNENINMYPNMYGKNNWSSIKLWTLSVECVFAVRSQDSEEGSKDCKDKDSGGAGNALECSRVPWNASMAVISVQTLQAVHLGYMRFSLLLYFNKNVKKTKNKTQLLL